MGIDAKLPTDKRIESAGKPGDSDIFKSILEENRQRMESLEKPYLYEPASGVPVKKK